MSYLPFHHKYRPQTFADLVGQEAIAATLTNALNLRKIAPAYLFTGPRGTGKTSSARILAKSLNCTASSVPTAEPCGRCGVCKSITTGNALDVIEIDAASNTGVDNIRELIERAQYAPVQCRYKVYTIDECHMLSVAAFNSLLKTLEEPPPHVVFILATTDPQRVLPTIISRCQKFDYRRIPLDAMVSHLGYIAQQESIIIHPTALQLIGQLSQGGLRDAESLLDQLSLLSGEITPDRVWDLVGTVPEGDLLGIAQAVSTGNLENLLDCCRQLVELGKEPLTILQNLTSFYRDLSIAKTAPQRPDLTTLTNAGWQQALQLSTSLELDQILAAQQHLRTSEQQLKNSTQPRLWLEIALLGLLTLPQQPLREGRVPLAHKDSVQQSSTPAPPIPTPIATQPPALAQDPTPMAPNPAPPEPLTPLDTIPASRPPAAPEINLSVTWQEALKQLLPSGRGLFAPHGSLLSIVDDLATVGIKSPTLTKFAEGQKPHLQKALSAILGRSITVRIQHTTNTPVAPTATSIAPTPTDPPTQHLSPREPEDLEMLEDAEEPAEVEAPSSGWEPIALPLATVTEEPAPLFFPHLDLVQPKVETNPQPVISVHQESVPNEDLEKAAAQLAERFTGEVIEEYAIAWEA